ncbi:MAG: adenosine kinase [Deltaproteobacteria bacterium]|nr:adenosine kinase [Deltaproteobacteria bacterium]
MGINWKNNRSKMVVGIGSALVDILTHQDDAFLQETGAVKGAMKLVEKQFIDQTISKTTKVPSIVSGGSACNTIVGIGRLGGESRFIGKRGDDDMGALFEEELIKSNVEPRLFTSSSPTGRVLSIITPDAQRSMFTYLGASAEILPEELEAECFVDAAVVHVEGYLLFNPDLITRSLEAAKNAGAVISLDLASFTIVEESKELLEKLTYDFVDILIANEDEARVFTGYADEMDAIKALSEKAEISVLKVGKRGSFISMKGEIIDVDPKGTGEAVDTTGAGDLWASGFLFGLVNGYPIEKCGELGSSCGHEVCQVIGANIPEHVWAGIRKKIDMF